MARNSGAGGGIFFLVLGVIWIMSKCGGDNTPSEPRTVAAPSQLSTPLVEVPDTLYVNTAGLNQRSAPNGPVVGKLSRAEPVNVFERSGSWVRVSPDGASPRWVSSSLLCSGAVCATASPARARAPTQSRRSKTKYVDDTCPCSGSRVCIGPRGGRFCITSGGNKRYGV